MNTLKHSIHAINILLFCLVILSSNTFAATGQPAKLASAPNTTPQQMHASHPADMPKGLWQAFSEAQYLFEPEQDKKIGMQFKGKNPKNRLNFSFNKQSVTYRSESRDNPWQLSMELVGYGTLDRQQSVPTHKLYIDGNRVIFDRGIVEEWYINKPNGLEQGFTLQTPPKQAKPDQEVVLTLKLNGNLNPRWQIQDQSLVFYTDIGDYAFNYAKLSVIDAKGKVLPAQMALDNNNLQLHFSAANAVWPVIVDPLTYTETKLIGAGNDAEQNAYFGYSVALSGNTALIGAYSNDDTCTGTDIDCGAAYVFIRSGGVWSLQQKLASGTPGLTDFFGYAVALNGDTALIGAYQDGTGGAAYVFTRSGSVWSQQQRLTANDPDANDRFGISVALEGDTALVGASRDETRECQLINLLNCGAAYVFTRSGNVWSQQQKLTAGDILVAPTQGNNRFGISVALSGNTALVGAYLDDIACGSLGCGAAYVFTHSGSSWIEQQKLTLGSLSGFYFGFSVALDGDTALIGAYRDSSTCLGTGSSCGAAYVFTRSIGVWSQQQKLVAGDADDLDYFGVSVALSGETALVGARLDSGACTGTDTECGAAYAYTRSGSTWTEQQKIVADDPDLSDNFGISLALEGNTALVGAFFDDGGCSGTDADCGAAYAFTRIGSVWSQQQKLIAAGIDEYDSFGNSVAINGDTALIGANGDANDKGSVFVFVRSNNNWIFQQKLIASDSVAGDYFGASVALSSDTAVIGAYGDDGYKGSAYVFMRFGTTWSQQAKLTNSFGDANDRFGSSVALSNDTVLIGAHGVDDSTGRVFVFVRFLGTSWSLQSVLFDVFSVSSDQFGSSVALDGDTALIGAYGASSFQGYAYVFERSGSSWSQQIRLTYPFPSNNTQFGSSVSISGDTVVIGAQGDSTDETNKGSAFVFVRSGTSWSQQVELTASDGVANDGFGSKVALYGDTAVISALGDDVFKGSVYLFLRSGSGWVQQAKITASDGVTADYFGVSVALSDDTILIGADHADMGTVADNGAAYLYSFPCGYGSGIVSNTWSMVGLPCDPGGYTVQDIFGDNLNPNRYGLRWIIYERDEVSDSYSALSLNSFLSQGEGYWVFSMDATVWDANGRETPINTSNPNCPSVNGCYEIDLTPPGIAEAPRFNQIGHVFPFDVLWQDVRFEVDEIDVYTPSEAEIANYAEKEMWAYNGNGYDPYDDATPGMEGTLDSHNGFWVAIRNAAAGKVIKLLVPVSSSLDAPPPPPILP